MSNDTPTKIDRLLAKLKNTPILWQILAFFIAIWACAELISAVLGMGKSLDDAFSLETPRSHLQQRFVEDLLDVTKRVDLLFISIPTEFNADADYRNFDKDYREIFGLLKGLRRTLLAFFAIDYSSDYTAGIFQREDAPSFACLKQSEVREDSEDESVFKAPEEPVVVVEPKADAEDVSNAQAQAPANNRSLFVEAEILSIEFLMRNIADLRCTHVEKGFVNPFFLQEISRMQDEVLTHAFVWIALEEDSQQANSFLGAIVFSAWYGLKEFLGAPAEGED
jgi:hypothetical protein